MPRKQIFYLTFETRRYFFGERFAYKAPQSNKHAGKDYCADKQECIHALVCQSCEPFVLKASRKNAMKSIGARLCAHLRNHKTVKCSIIYRMDVDSEASKR